MDEWMDQGGDAYSSMTLASLGASFTDIRFNSTSTFLIPLPYATWIWSAVNGASCQYCFLPFSPMVCVWQVVVELVGLAHALSPRACFHACVMYH